MSVIIIIRFILEFTIKSKFTWNFPQYLAKMKLWVVFQLFIYLLGCDAQPTQLRRLPPISPKPPNSHPPPPKIEPKYRIIENLYSQPKFTLSIQSYSASILILGESDAKHPGSLFNTILDSDTPIIMGKRIPGRVRLGKTELLIIEVQDKSQLVRS